MCKENDVFLLEIKYNENAENKLNELLDNNAVLSYI
jgi:hypothetical protein